MSRTVPWDFSKVVKHGDADAVPNLPDEDGRALGQQLARLTDIEEAKQLPEFPGMARRCDECAFRLGTLPNGCVDTLMDALKCVIEGEPFYCHKGLKDDDDTPKRICMGWMVLYTSREEAEKKAHP